MPEKLEIQFVGLEAPLSPTSVLLTGPELVLGAATRRIVQPAHAQLERAAAAAEFKGKTKSSLEILAPDNFSGNRLLLLGTGKGEEHKELDWINLGGAAYARIVARTTNEASLVADTTGEPDAAGNAKRAALLAYGALLRSYAFRKYRSRGEEENQNGTDSSRRLKRLDVHCADPDSARRAFAQLAPVGEGVFFARDLVNEPANVLGPVEFCDRLREMAPPGLELEVLDENALRELKMGALLGVAQGSERPPRVAVMQWNGAKSKRAKPVCFIGKGVVFDTGGISMKPAAGMEDMKGDMAGAACVAGLMRALAGRKANVNAIGLVGLVENMPSGKAQRPGDIVTSMSGQTIEVLNTDAEGRLVLADVLWYAQDRFKPRLMVDLATLTGAIIVALGKEHAGLFSNDERLANELIECGEATGEKVWRMPLAKAYDKLIDGRTGDIKNIGGRNAGAITAAQFLQRFVKDTPWAHLDIAGTAMDSPRNDINDSWASGWGVRLLDRLVADKYEKVEK